MRNITIPERTNALIDQLTDLWEQSVKATHLFLSAPEIAKIKPYLPIALRQMPHLIIAETGNGSPIGFIGIENRKIEILSSDLAFDHAKIIASALKGLQTSYGLRSLAFAFWPAEFTINELQNVHELLTGKKLLVANFRRKIMPYLIATAWMTQGDGHRPAQIYIRNSNMED